MYRGEEGRPIQPSRQEFENLLSFRIALRRFQRWSEDQAAAAGLTHVQHQLLVAIKGHPDPTPPSVRQIADYLMLQSHSAVGLVDRAETAGLVRRRPDRDDARVVRVELTGKGDKLVTDLTAAHLLEVHKLAIALGGLLPPGTQASQQAASDRRVAGGAVSLLADTDPGHVYRHTSGSKGCLGPLCVASVRANQATQAPNRVSATQSGPRYEGLVHRLWSARGAGERRLRGMPPRS
jgi:DNA-binding MarR family transcriptional regulator